MTIQRPPAPHGAQFSHSPDSTTPVRSSLFVDDMPDDPLGPGDYVGWYFVDGEYRLVDPFLDWPEYLLYDADQPSSVPTDGPEGEDVSAEPTPLDDNPDGDQPTPVDVSSKVLSAFTTRFEKVPAAAYTVESWLGFIRDGSQAQRVASIRASRGTAAYDRGKKKLPCTSFSGAFPNGRAGQIPTESSGLIFLELDHHDGPPPAGWLASERARLGEHPGVVAAYVSAGGQGIHIVAAVDPIPTSRKEHTQAWAWASRELQIADTGDHQVKDITRLSYPVAGPSAERRWTTPRARR